MRTNAPLWMIANAASGSHRAEVVNEVAAILAAAGRPVDRLFRLGEDALPTGQEARDARVSLIVIHGGDGTITSATDALEGWDGELLVLPGGTMNLLSHALHGDLPVVEIVRLAASSVLPAIRVPVIKGEGYCALAGVIAGPTSAWGDVREHVRHADIRALASSIGEALTQTLAGDEIALEGQEGSYQAIYLQPTEDGIAARGVLARHAGHLIQHGWAWLSGDFREGPSVDLGIAPAVTLCGHGPVGLLVDGERAEAGSTLRFHSTRSTHRYLSCLGRAVWS